MNLIHCMDIITYHCNTGEDFEHSKTLNGVRIVDCTIDNKINVSYRMLVFR